MPAVFVHGNPETPVVWRQLIAHLERDDVITLHLPGFGIPTPEGFAATKEEYVDWLIDQLEAIDGPIDLVGHDWGGGFTLRLACTRPDLVRSWVADVAGLLHPDYVWHDFAQIWQTPGAGEEYFDTLLGLPLDQLAAALEAAGMTGIGHDVAEVMDAEMGRCVLALYRSAAQPAMQEWGTDAEKARARPGLVLVPADDQFAGGTSRAEQVGARMGAQVDVMEGVGHWWMLQQPLDGARRLEAFWAGVG